MFYSVTKQEMYISNEDGLLYKFIGDGSKFIMIDYYELVNGVETKVNSFHIHKDCISTFISVLEQMK